MLWSTSCTEHSYARDHTCNKSWKHIVKYCKLHHMKIYPWKKLWAALLTLDQPTYGKAYSERENHCLVSSDCTTRILLCRSLFGIGTLVAVFAQYLFIVFWMTVSVTLRKCSQGRRVGPNFLPRKDFHMLMIEKIFKCCHLLSVRSLKCLMHRNLTSLI